MTRLIHSKEVDQLKWDRLVQSDATATVFNFSYLLNELAEDWFLYTDQHYSFGVVIPVKKILMMDTVYAPIFYRCSDLVGDQSKFNQNDFIASLKEHFHAIQINLSFGLTGEKGITRYYQTVVDYKLKTLAKRQLKKIKNSSLKIEFNTNDPSELIDFIFKELRQKITLYKSEKLKTRFKRLVLALIKKKQLVTIEARNGSRLVGGVIAMNDHKRIIYLKGAALRQLKEEGAMYLLMDELINYSKNQQLQFDFGGSSDPNVRFFNTRFNGVDQSYYVYNIKNSPKWLVKLKQVKKWIQR